MPNAIDIIREEHRNYVAVLRCFEGVVGDVERGRLAPDFALFHAILDYTAEFLDSYHHPKEDEYLFRMMRERDPTAAALLERLERQHQEGYRLLAALRGKLQAYEENAALGKDFFAAAQAYRRFEWDHMRSEEMDLIPRAQAALTPDQWAALDAAFSDNDDPLFGAQPKAKFAGLLQRIAEMAPAPHGYGRSR